MGNPLWVLRHAKFCVRDIEHVFKIMCHGVGLDNVIINKTATRPGDL